jgi:hypothetical protein
LTFPGVVHRGIANGEQPSTRGEINVTPVQKPKVVEMDAQMSGLFRSQAKEKSAAFANMGPLCGIAPTAQ